VPSPRGLASASGREREKDISPCARAHPVAATRPTASRRGTFHGRCGRAFGVHTGRRAASAHFVPRRLYSDQPVAQRGSPTPEGDEDPCERAGKCQNAEHFQRCDCDPVQAVHFTPPNLAQRDQLSASQQCTRHTRQLS
jgi:hypothetical protein